MDAHRMTALPDANVSFQAQSFAFKTIGNDA
jgi:hypothetical protein